jgi:N-acetylmuramoyl-L-alanine amidase
MGAWAARITDLRWGTHAEFTRCVVDYSGSPPRVTLEDRSADLRMLYCDLWNVDVAWEKSETLVDDPNVRSYQSIYLASEKRVRLAIRVTRPLRPSTQMLSDPGRVVIDLAWGASPASATSSAAPSTASPPVREAPSARSPFAAPPASASSPAAPTTAPPPPAQPTASRKKPLVILDPGHGGWHKGASGTVSGQTVWEKDLTMSMARKTKALLDSRGRCEVILTRTQDVYMGLYERVQFAEKREGDLFVSIHCNATGNPSARNRARGLEFWYWNKNGSTSAAARELERLENDESGNPGLSQALPRARRLLSSLMADQLEIQALQSRKVAEIMEGVFLRQSYFRQYYRGIHSARFKVLENYMMPSVLVEVGFLTHPTEARLLASNPFQDMAARCMADSIEQVLRELAAPAPATVAGLTQGN